MGSMCQVFVSSAVERAAALPATQPVDQAHWKLYANPGEGPSDAIEHYAHASSKLPSTHESDEDA